MAREDELTVPVVACGDDVTAGVDPSAADKAASLTAQDAPRMTPGRAILIGLGWLSLAVGVIGVFVPVLPTTEFVMLAAFLFAKSSPRFHAWLLNTKVYRTYVKPFKETGGIPRNTKIRMIAISMAVLIVSACIVRIWWVWVILGVCAAAILYMLLVRVPTRADESETN